MMNEFSIFKLDTKIQKQENRDTFYGREDCVRS